MKVRKGDRVKVHYKGTLEDGTIFDSSEGGEPLEFEVGAGQIIEGFERGVMGMEEGEEKRLSVPPEKAYGPHREEMVGKLPAEQVRDLDVQPGSTIQVQTKQGEAIIRDTKHGEDDEIDLLPQTMEALETWLAVRPRYEDTPERWPNPKDRDALFVTTWRGTHRRLTKGGLWSMVKRYAKREGVERTVSPHLFRHTGVTWMAERGMSYRQIALQTGHRDLETLMKVYDHPDRERAREAFDAAMGGSSSPVGGAPVQTVEDLLQSLPREQLLGLFREALLLSDDMAEQDAPRRD